MKQMNMRKNGKMTVGMLLLFLCIVLAVLVPVLAPGHPRKCMRISAVRECPSPILSGQISLEEICLYGFGAELGSVCVSGLQVHF